MTRHIPGLHSESRDGNGLLEGSFLVRVDRAFYRWHPQKPFFALRFSILEPKERAGQTISGRVYCTAKALWRLNWFLRDFGYDHDLFNRDEVDEKALLGLKGVIRTSRTTRDGRTFLNLDAFASSEEWEELALPASGNHSGRENNDAV
jgi:hypothetical protein